MAPQIVKLLVDDRCVQPGKRGIGPGLAQTAVAVASTAIEGDKRPVFGVPGRDLDGSINQRGGGPRKPAIDLA
jgi:hypothetical protein